MRLVIAILTSGTEYVPILPGRSEAVRPGAAFRRKLRMPEDGFCRELAVYGSGLDLDVVVICPDRAAGEWHSYRLAEGEWQECGPLLPDIVYDRCFGCQAGERSRCRTLLKTLAERKPFVLLSSELPGKWEVYRTLRRYPELAPLLPPTMRYDGAASLRAAARAYGDDLILKPAAGMQGRGIIRIRTVGGRLRLTGRSRLNRPFTLSFADATGCSEWTKRFIGTAHYLIQPYLQLADSSGRPFDLRVLMQKNGNGRWTETGSAIRLGFPGSVTSNLHGGGTPRPARAWLRETYGETAADDLLGNIVRWSHTAAETLEQNYGRFAEIGFDYGIDRNGRPWLLEANSKPGRQSFRMLGDSQAAKDSVIQPLLYARLLGRRYSPFETNVS